MKRYGNSEILVTVEELVTLSKGKLKAETIYASYGRSSRLENPKSWLTQTDCLDGKLVLYGSIPNPSILKHKLPTLSTLINQLKLQEAINTEEAKQQKKDLHRMQLDAALQAAADNFAKFCPKYFDVFSGKKENRVIEFAKRHSVLQCCLDLRKGKVHTIAEIHQGYMQIEGIKHTLKNLEKFRSNLAKWAKSGINILHEWTGKARPHIVKLSDWHIAKIEQYYSNPQQYTIKTVHELLTKECTQYGKTLISIASVSKYVANTEVKNRLSLRRNKKVWNDKVQPSTRRIAPTFAADLYYADGSPLQITCWNAARTKVIRLNLFVVMDVKSGKIVGFDLAESEDRYTWLAAFKMAFSTQMMLPYEVMYDNASATKTAEFEAVKEALLLKGCRLNPTTKGEPKQKANIERWFGTFQTGFQRMIEGFVGEGIRSKRDNGRIDIEHLASLQKSQGYYSYAQMIEIAANLITIYNSKTERKRKAPNKVFAESEKPNAVAIGHADIAMLFWLHKKLKVSNSEVRMTVRNNEYYYVVYDHATALKLDGKQVKVYYDETDLSTVHLFDLAGNPITECRQKIGFHQAKANQTEADVLQIIKQSKHNEAKKTVAKRISAEIAAAGMLGNEETFLQTFNPYEVALKDAANDAETAVLLNYTQQQKGVEFGNGYEPVTCVIEPVAARNKPTLQERHAKKNIVPATLEIIKRPK